MPLHLNPGHFRPSVARLVKELSQCKSFLTLHRIFLAPEWVGHIHGHSVGSPILIYTLILGHFNVLSGSYQFSASPSLFSTNSPYHSSVTRQVRLMIPINHPHTPNSPYSFEDIFKTFHVIEPIEKWGTGVATKGCEIVKAAGWCDPTTTTAQCVDICKGIIAEEAPVIFDAVYHRLLSPNAACVEMKACEPNGVFYPTQSYTDSGKRDTEGVGYIIHISDIHVDPYYAVGSNIDCGYPLCCRDVNVSTSTTSFPSSKLLQFIILPFLR
jgi:hypothetical protein